MGDRHIRQNIISAVILKNADNTDNVHTIN